MSLLNFLSRLAWSKALVHENLAMRKIRKIANHDNALDRNSVIDLLGNKNKKF